MFESTRGLKLDSTKTEVGDLVFALASVACHTGEQAGALLLITQVLVRHNLITTGEAKRLVDLLSADSPEAQRHVKAHGMLRRKPKRTRQ